MLYFFSFEIRFIHSYWIPCCKKTDTMDLSHILRSACSLCEQLAAIHYRDEYHGNLNLDSIQQNGVEGFPLLITRAGQSFSQYTSPEQTGRINRQVDYRTDLYSFGIYLYQQLTGQLPYTCSDDFELIHAIVALTPVAPHKVDSSIPEVVSEIVMKLLSKNAEDRYQSANGLKHDLEKCLSFLADPKNSSQLRFLIGENDFSGRFEIHQKLFGREKETEFLSDAIDRIVDRPAELLLITGPPGIGKTLLVNQFRDKLLEKKGYFVSGKCEQYKRNTPFSALIQAFNGLITRLLTESPASLGAWRSKLETALTVNGQVMVDVLPGLELIIGRQPRVKELGPTETQHRFHFVLERFVEVFTQKENPLVIFLDDIQWIDQATLNLLEMIITTPGNKCILMIGAYRDNEVDLHHPLIQAMNRLDKKSGAIQSILLKPLEKRDMAGIIANTLKCTEEEANPLAKLCLKKTEGNPFYFKQFLTSLYHTKIISFDSMTNRWTWNMKEIGTMNLTDNLAGFLIRKINEFPAGARELLMLASAMGNQFNSGMLLQLSINPPDEVNRILRWATRENIIISFNAEKEAVYRFSHDQIQMAVYSLIPMEELKVVHFRIGQYLLQQKHELAEDENLFEIVSHLNIARELLQTTTEKLQLARLNLRAGIKAKKSVAYSDALMFFRTAKELLPASSWTDNYSLVFGVFYSLIESSILSGDLDGMDSYIESASQHVRDVLDKVKISHLRILSFYSVNNPAEAVKFSFETLKMLGIVYPATVTPEDIQSALLNIEALLKEKNFDDLLALPNMEEPEKIETLRIISSLLHGIFFVAPQYFPLLAATCVELSVKYGNAPHSIPGYAVYGLVLCAVANDYEKGFRFGILATELLKKTGYREFTAQTTVIFYNLIAHWKQHVITGIPFLKEAHQTGLESGDIPYAVDCIHGYCYYSFFAGKSLGFLCSELDSNQSKLTGLHQENSLHYILLQIYHQVFENFISKDDEQDLLFGENFNEGQVSADDLQTRGMTALFVFYTFKSFLGLIFEKYEHTLEYISKGNENLPEQHPPITSRFLNSPRPLPYWP